MQLFNSDRGVLRRNGEIFFVLDGLADLDVLIATGRLDEARRAPDGAAVQLKDVELRAPVRPTRLFQVGLNYHSHLTEIGLEAPAEVIYAVTEVTDQISDPGATVTFPPDDPEQVDYESEIAVVIGADASKIDAAHAWEVVAGVCACNDVSARGLQRAGFASGDRAAGKMLTGFKPLGPGLLTVDEIAGAPIELRLTLNGEVRQATSSDDMVFSIPSLIEVISAEHALVPGDVIMTGSPAGVGAFTDRFLRPGDVAEVTCGDLPPLRTHFAGS